LYVRSGASLHASIRDEVTRCSIRLDRGQQMFQDETHRFRYLRGKATPRECERWRFSCNLASYAAMDSGPTPSHSPASPMARAGVFAESEEGARVKAHARAQHFGVSAMILGVALVFLGFLVRAERREVQLLLSANAPCELELLVAASSNAADPPSATDASMCAPTMAIERGATGYGHSLLAAETAAALAALTLVARRRRLWIAAVFGVLVCMSAATATFAGTRAETHRVLAAWKSQPQ
jgi:hypothetical protein